MYSLNMPTSQIRTKMRQEFERHRYVNQLAVVDKLLFQSSAEYQVRLVPSGVVSPWSGFRFYLRLNNLIGIGWAGRTHTDLITGNAELLEAITTHPEILPRRRGSDLETAPELHEWFPRGMSHQKPLSSHS